MTLKPGLQFAEAALKIEGSFYQKIGLIFTEKTSKVLHLEHSFVKCLNLDTS